MPEWAETAAILTGWANRGKTTDAEISGFLLQVRHTESHPSVFLMMTGNNARS